MLPCFGRQGAFLATLEASALTHAGRRGLLARRSPLLRLQGDERLVALLRRGNDNAFEAIVDRYQARLLGFCRQMLSSTEDAEDVLQEVFVNAYRAILADNREIKLRPWLYRIARNRCLNHLRKPVAEGKDSMDVHPIVDAASTHERVQNREEFRQLLSDVGRLPETQRSALLLREMDAMSYEEIAEAMQTTVPSVKSLLVRARIALAEESQARMLTCGEVRLELAEAAEGLGKASGPVRRHLRECDGCADFRDQLRSDSKALAAIFPAGPLLLFKGLLLSKLGLSGAGASGGAGAAGASGAGAGAAGGAAVGGGAGVGGVGAIGGAVGAKAVAGVVTAAVITAGAAVEVKQVSHAATPGPRDLEHRRGHRRGRRANRCLPLRILLRHSQKGEGTPQGGGQARLQELRLRGRHRGSGSHRSGRSHSRPDRQAPPLQGRRRGGRQHDRANGLGDHHRGSPARGAEHRAPCSRPAGPPGRADRPHRSGQRPCAAAPSPGDPPPPPGDEPAPAPPAA